MIELEKEQFITVKSIAYEVSCDKVFPLSIVEGNQKGRIFVDDINHMQVVLFWHYCGFGHLCGKPNQALLKDIIRLLKGEFEENQSRFVLHINNVKTESYFAHQAGIEQLRGYLFQYNKDKIILHKPPLKEPYSLQEVNVDILHYVHGRIIPAFSWTSNDEFLQRGKGYCITYNNEIASIAFTTAIGGGQIDIGVETNEKYRGQGLAKVVASKMTEYVISIGFEPVWECDSKNLASRSVAENIGFELSDSISVFRKSTV